MKLTHETAKELSTLALWDVARDAILQGGASLEALAALAELVFRATEGEVLREELKRRNAA